MLARRLGFEAINDLLVYFKAEYESAIKLVLSSTNDTILHNKGEANRLSKIVEELTWLKSNPQ